MVEWGREGGHDKPELSHIIVKPVFSLDVSSVPQSSKLQALTLFLVLFQRKEFFLSPSIKK
jgi:hypothetical protein